MSPKPRRDASEPAREKGREAEAEADAINNILDEEARAGVAALLTPDAEALAAVCNSDDDDDDDEEGRELDTGDVTIREGEGREDYLVRGKREGPRSWLACRRRRPQQQKNYLKKKKGSELATYIFVDLPSDAPLPAPGSSVTIRGLETASPSIEFPAEEKEEDKGKGKGKKGAGSSPSSSFSAEGGEWKESVGSLLFVAKPSTTDSAPAPGSYLCHTERILSFRKE